MVGNSLLQDVKVDVTTDGYPVKVSEQSGATLSDIDALIDKVAEKETLKEIVIVGGTREVTDKVPVERIREQLTGLVTKAKAKAPAVTVSSVLPVLKRADAEFVAEVNRQMRTTCDELKVKFVDNDANFTPGQCAKCGETNRVTINCWHSRKVECRQCGQLGHKDWYHTMQ